MQHGETRRAQRPCHWVKGTNTVEHCRWLRTWFAKCMNHGSLGPAEITLDGMGDPTPIGVRAGDDWEACASSGDACNAEGALETTDGPDSL
jgi:hypothetical protein